MWGSIISYIASGSNYGVTNMNNIFNFLLSIMDDMNNEQKEDLINKIIIHLGREFYKKFRKYVTDKLPNSEHVKIIDQHYLGIK